MSNGFSNRRIVPAFCLPRNGEDMAQRPAHCETNEHGPAQVERQWGIIMPPAQDAQNMSCHIYMGGSVTARRLPCDIDVLFDMRNLLQDPLICTHPTSSRPLGILPEYCVRKVDHRCFMCDYILFGYKGKQRRRTDL